MMGISKNKIFFFLLLLLSMVFLVGIFKTNVRAADPDDYCVNICIVHDNKGWWGSDGRRYASYADCQRAGVNCNGGEIYVEGSCVAWNGMGCSGRGDCNVPLSFSCGGWGSCSRTCGGGTQYRTCSSQCSSRTESRSCNNFPCCSCSGTGTASCSVGGYAGTKRCNGCQWNACVPYEYCGDKIVNGPEACDGNTTSCSINGYAGYRECQANCAWKANCIQTEFCGDGKINGQDETIEECDDGNTTNGDGCNSTCKVEADWKACNSSPQQIVFNLGTLTSTFQGLRESKYVDTFLYDVNFTKKIPTDLNSSYDNLSNPAMPSYVYTTTYQNNTVSKKIIINFTLYGILKNPQIVFRRAGSELNNVYLDGASSMVTQTRELVYRIFYLPLKQINPGKHTITVEYAKGGSDGGNEITAIAVKSCSICGDGFVGDPVKPPFVNGRCAGVVPPLPGTTPSCNLTSLPIVNYSTPPPYPDPYKLYTNTGTGSDGNCNYTSNITLPTTKEYNCNQLNIANGVVVRASGGNPLIFRVKGNATIAGTIDVSGVAGGNASIPLSGNGGTGIAGGTNGGKGGITTGCGGFINAANGLGSGGGGAGARSPKCDPTCANSQSGGGGGGGGHRTAGAQGETRGICSGGTDGVGSAAGPAFNTNNPLLLTGGSGGGGGGSETSNGCGGGGGAGGGAVAITAKGDVVINGVIRANGGAGGSEHKGAGSGGGGAGGSVVVLGQSVTNNGSLVANGGAGTAGNKDGGNGGAGHIYTAIVQNGTYEYQASCEECDDGPCGSSRCYGPNSGPEFACRFKASNCCDGIKQYGEVCDDCGGTCNKTCTGFSYCGDGELNQPYNGSGLKEECDPGKHCTKKNSIEIIDCTVSAADCADDCIVRNTDDCDIFCRVLNQSYWKEVGPGDD